jgi:hypothetical protein
MRSVRHTHAAQATRKGSGWRCWAGAFGLGLLGLLVGCAHPRVVNPTVGPKVQTVEQLLVKLKKAFDEGRIGETDFYANELGYRLSRPLRVPPKYAYEKNQWQQIHFGGELEKSHGGVMIWPIADGTPYASFGIRFVETACIDLKSLRDIWGKGNYQLPYTPPPHGAVALPELEIYRRVEPIKEVRATFPFSTNTPHCLTGVTVNETFLNEQKESK